MKFTYSDYRYIVRNLKEMGYVSHHIDGNEFDGKCLYLRHDVDTDFLGVLPLAEVEHEEDVVSTWYFLPDCPVYNIFSEEVSNIIYRLVSLGHCVGLHVDGKRFSSTKQMQAALDGTLAYADALGIKSLSRTFSFHRPAPWLLQQGIEIGGGWVNAYSERYYGLSDNIVYVSDSNRREFWNEERMGNAIANRRNLTLLTHPVWWHHSALSSDETFAYLSETVGSRHTALYFAATARRYADKCPEEIIRC